MSKNTMKKVWVLGVCWSWTHQAVGGQPLPIRHLFYLVQPWVGLAVGKSKRFIGASHRHSLPFSVHHHPSFISPTCLLYQSQNTWWLSKTRQQLEERTSPSKNRHLRQSSAHLLSPLHHFLPPQWCSCSSKHIPSDSWAPVNNKVPVHFTTSRGVNLHQN